MKLNRLSKQTLAIAVCAMILVTLTVMRYSHLIQSTLTLEVQKNLGDVAHQNAVSITNEIIDKFNLLHSISQEIQKTELNESRLMPQLNACTETYGFKRMGIVDANGITTTTDGYKQDLSYRDFYQDGMKGISCITNSLTDMIGSNPESINVFSVPIYNQSNEVEGVLFATYRTQLFNDILSIDSFDNMGISCIINESADIIALSNSAPDSIKSYSNMLEYLQSSNSAASDAVTQFNLHIQNEEEGIGKYNSDRGNYYYYMMPLENMRSDRQWFILTIVPEQVLWNLASPINEHVRSLISIVFLICIAGFCIYLYTYHKQKRELLDLAYTDPLTGGNNFAGFQNSLQHKDYGTVSYVTLDLQNFKLINTSCGIEKGNETLREVWKVLLDNLQVDELSARINSDRFLFILLDKDKETIGKRLDKLTSDLEAISARLNIPRIFPLMGIYQTSDHSEPEQIYGKTVQAKHIIKGMRTRHYAFYDELNVDQLNELHQIEDDFEGALKNGEFHVWYQPKIDPYTGSILGAEALIRWIKPDGKLLPPVKFIPLFEKNGSIATLDEYVFRQVCEQQKTWQDKGLTLYPISVNISRISLYFGNIVQKYKSILDEYQLDPKYLPLEITESATINNSEISGLIDQFHKAGFAMLLDDFGSGYSSLSSLNVMHFDTIKLDKSLVDYIGDANGEKLLHSITHLAHSLGMNITAEGVETASQVEFLKKEKCTDIQGYYYSKPLPVEQFEQFAKETH